MKRAPVCKLLIFYPLLLSSAIFFATLEEEVHREYFLERVMYGSVKLANDIIMEHKLADRWLTGSRMTPRITTNFLDETNVRRYILGFNLATEEYQYMLTYLFNQVNKNEGNTADILSSFYLGGPFFDLRFELRQRSAANTDLTVLHVKVTAATVNFAWKVILKLAPVGVEWYLEDCLDLLAEEVKRQFTKKLEMEQAFGVGLEADVDLKELLSRDSSPQLGTAESYAELRELY